MNRLIAGVAAALVTSALIAQPQPCPSVQWSIGPGSSLPGDLIVVTSLGTIDYDEDGKLDVVGTVAGNSSYTLMWWKGTGVQTFALQPPIATDFSMSNVVIADATGDGRDDVLVSLYSAGKLLILPGTGSGRGPAIQTPPRPAATWISAVNRDADPAVELVASVSNSLVVYDDIAGSMTVLAQIPAVFPTGIASADFDGDGHFDVAVSSRSQHVVEMYYGKADGTYEAPVSLGGVDPLELRVADLNEDGRPDIVVANNEILDVPPEASVSIYLNEGARTFTHSRFSINRPGQYGDTSPVLLADVSGDGHLDLLAGAVNGSWTTTAVGVGDGTFRTPTYLHDRINGTPVSPGALATGDFDGDGRLDLVIGAYFGLYPANSSCTTHDDFYSVSPVISLGQQATLHAHISGFGPDTPEPRGTVTLRDGTTVLDSAPVGADGQASFVVSNLALGYHVLTAHFSGNAGVAAGGSNNLVQTVTSDTTQMTITLPASPAVYGQPFPIQITIADTLDWVTVDLDGVQAQQYTGGTFNRTLEPGSHTISVQYLGSSSKPPTHAGPVTFNVAKATPNVGVSGTLAVRAGTAHSLTFAVSGSGAIAPSGSVQLIEGTTILVTTALVNGSATLNVPLSRGAHNVQAYYTGDAHYSANTQNVTLEVLPTLPLFIEVRGLAGGVHIAYVLPADTNMNSLQLLRRPAGTTAWIPAGGWSAVTGMDAGTLPRGVAYEYQLTALLAGGSPIASNIDSALLFNDDLLVAGVAVKRTHFSELRAAVNLLRAQAGLPPFDFEASYDTSASVRASHLTTLRAALTEARQQLGMSTSAFMAVATGTIIRADQIQELRELAR
jgi:hypothetical protein